MSEPEEYQPNPKLDENRAVNCETSKTYKCKQHAKKAYAKQNKKLKDEHPTDSFPEPYITSADLVGLDEDDAAKLLMELATKGAGTIYTQVDASGNGPSVLYSKGVRFVNRTGVYAFVFKRD